MADFVFARDDYTVRKVDLSDMSVAASYSHISNGPAEHFLGPDGFLYAAGDNGTLHKINPVDMSQSGVYSGHTETIMEAIFGDDGYLYTASFDETVHKIDASDMSQVAVYSGHTAAVFHVLYGPDGYIYSGGWDNKVHKIDPADMSQVATCSGAASDSMGSVTELYYSPDGYIYCVCDDKTVRKIDPSTMEQVGKNSDSTNYIWASDFDSSGNMYFGVSGGTIYKINTSDMSLIDTFTQMNSGVEGLIYDAGGYLFAGAGGDVRKIDPSTMAQVDIYNGPADFDVTELRLLSDGNLYAGSYDSTLYRINPADMSFIDSVQISPDNSDEVYTTEIYSETSDLVYNIPTQTFTIDFPSPAASGFEVAKISLSVPVSNLNMHLYSPLPVFYSRVKYQVPLSNMVVDFLPPVSGTYNIENWPVPAISLFVSEITPEAVKSTRLENVSEVDIPTSDFSNAFTQNGLVWEKTTDALSLYIPNISSNRNDIRAELNLNGAARYEIETLARMDSAYNMLENADPVTFFIEIIKDSVSTIIYEKTITPENLYQSGVPIGLSFKISAEIPEEFNGENVLLSYKVRRSFDKYGSNPEDVSIDDIYIMGTSLKKIDDSKINLLTNIFRPKSDFILPPEEYPFTKTVYRILLNGFELPVSQISIYHKQQDENFKTKINVTVPDLSFMDLLRDNIGKTLSVEKGFVLRDGSVQYERLARAEAENVYRTELTGYDVLRLDGTEIKESYSDQSVDIENIFKKRSDTLGTLIEAPLVPSARPGQKINFSGPGADFVDGETIKHIYMNIYATFENMEVIF